MSKAPIVLAISGPAGSGKTTITRALAAKLKAPTLFFDDYAANSDLPRDLRGWLGRGADFNEWQTPTLVADLQKLRQGETITGPDGQAVAPDRFVLVENPLGCAQKDLAGCIDYLVFLDTPLEVALARFMLRELTSGAGLTRFAATDEAERHAALQMYLQGYLDVFRHVYHEQRRQVTDDADLIVDADRPVEEIVETISEAVSSKYGLPA